MLSRQELYPSTNSPSFEGQTLRLIQTSENKNVDKIIKYRKLNSEVVYYHLYQLHFKIDQRLLVGLPSVTLL